MDYAAWSAHCPPRTVELSLAYHCHHKYYRPEDKFLPEGRISGTKYRVVLPGVVFAKGCEFLLVSLREGVGVGFKGGGGGWLSSGK